MVNFICGLLASIVLTLFAGGLAISIWGNTGSIAFPIIVSVVLVMNYAHFVQSVKSGGKET